MPAALDEPELAEEPELLDDVAVEELAVVEEVVDTALVEVAWRTGWLEGDDVALVFDEDVVPLVDT